MEIYGGSTNPSNLRKFGAIDSYLIWSGEYWRLATSIFLHVGASHLAINSISLVIMGGLAERIYGHWNFIFIFLITGLIGSSTSYLNIGNGVVGAGASGAIFGCLGSLVSYFYVQRNSSGKSGKQTFNGLIILALVNLAFGFVLPAVDNWAHIGGFVSGLGLGYFLINSTKIYATDEQYGFVKNLRPIRSASVFISSILIVILLLMIGHLIYEPENIFQFSRQTILTDFRSDVAIF
ncbi:rhomboid family intramembrane serine protease [Chloroflexi bacterium]|nr:rhomboid family intramembrane serine protease [Chloroflexota bacterium]